jgi:DNA segregation ATPase FtsK/SpoIIIE, S-DNA-T family
VIARVLLWGVAVLAVTGVLVAPVLRGRNPRLHWLLFGYAVTVVRMWATWRALAVECGLSTSRRGGLALLDGLLVKGREVRPVVPGLRVGLPNRGGLVASVRLLAGQTPDFYIDAAEAMAHAWRVHAVRVTSARRGFATLSVLAVDPLTVGGAAVASACGSAVAGASVRVSLRERVAAAARVLLHGPQTVSAVVNCAAPEGLAVRVGVREDGRAWVLDLDRVPHWLIVGATQSGKSTLINALMCGLSSRRVALVGIDLKGGLALAPWRARLSALATTRTEALGLLVRLVEEMTDRMSVCAGAGVRSVGDLRPELRPVPVVVVVDEVAELYLIAERSEKDEAARVSTALVRLGQLGAALGVHLVVAGQRVGSELGAGVTALRAQLGGRVCHRVSDPETAVMTLGDLAPDAVATALTILPVTLGIAVTADETGAWTRVCSSLVTVAEAEHTASTFAHLSPVLPGLSSDGGR